MTDPSTRNLLGALRDLATLQAWIKDTGPVSMSELMSASHRVDRTLEIWRDRGCPNAPESLELEGT